MALTTLDILKLIAPFKRSDIFKGVFACDSLPSSFSLPAAFVINLSGHTSRGSHWVGLFISKSRSGEYFDSFGFPPKQIDIINFIRKHCRNFKFNDKQIQHVSSNKCGKFVCLFILSMMCNMDFHDVLSMFSLNLSVNEIVIENTINYFIERRRHLIKFNHK